MKYLFIFILIFCFGCSVGKFGNFTKNTPTNYYRIIAKESAMQLAELYPPAKVPFVLQHSSEDRFGIILKHILRKKGYAIAENSQEPSKYELSYIIDGNDKFYMIAFQINKRRLSRAYDVRDGKLLPAGAWSYQQ